MNPLAFSKWEGLGNDFIVVDARKASPPDPSSLAQVICDRHFGAGADGLVLVTEPTDGADLGVEIYNSDGSVALMCGNAVRCLAAMAHREGMVSSKTGEITFSTASGVRSTRLLAVSPWWVEVDMGRPVAWGEGADPRAAAHRTRVTLDGRELPAFLVSMGNPHCVIPMTRLLEAPWRAWGEQLEKRGLNGEEGTNLEFVEVQDAVHLDLRVWERGAGPTLACGTGACAAVVAMAQTGRCNRTARVTLPGGALEVEWTRAGNVLMRGPARELFRAEWRPDPH